MARPVAVQRTEDAVCFDDFPHRRHQRPRALFLDRLCVIDLAGGVIEDRDQIVIPAVLEPGMLAREWWLRDLRWNARLGWMSRLQTGAAPARRSRALSSQRTKCR
jgi:hypothetical protein